MNVDLNLKDNERIFFSLDRTLKDLDLLSPGESLNFITSRGTNYGHDVNKFEKIARGLRNDFLKKPIIGYTVNVFSYKTGDEIDDFSFIGLNFYKHKRRVN